MEKRKQYFIDKKFQTRFILKFCAINILASVLIGALIYALNRQTNTVAFENLRVVVKSTSDFILPILLEVIVIVSIVVALATIVIALLISHRISGPLFGLTKQISAIREGDLNRPIRIRASDQLQQVASEFEQLRLKFWNIVQTCKDQTEALDRLTKSGTAGRDDVEAMRDKIGTLKNQLDQFKTK